MSKKTAIAEAIISPADQPITSLIDLGYRQSGTRDTLQKQARYAIGNIVGFPESIDDDSKALLYQGYKRRYNENYPPIMFAIVSGNYIKFDSLAPDAQEKVKEKVLIGVDVVYSYTQQEFGKLKLSDPAKHAAIKSMRDPCTDYMSGCLSDLKSAARKTIKADNPDAHTRAPNKDFAKKVDDALEGLLTGIRTALKRGDATADKDRLIKAVAAFKAAWVK